MYLKTLNVIAVTCISPAFSVLVKKYSFCRAAFPDYTIVASRTFDFEQEKEQHFGHCPIILDLTTQITQLNLKMIFDSSAI